MQRFFVLLKSLAATLNAYTSETRNAVTHPRGRGRRPRPMVLKRTKHLLSSASRKTMFLSRKLTNRLGRSGDAKSTESRLKATAEKSGNAREQKQQWMDLILSKEFDVVLKEIFAKCSTINHDVDDETEPCLDLAELTVAIDCLYKRLESMMGGQKKLPRIKETTETILAKYDDNNDGHLDAREWEGFARTYFSRMEWPVWKTAARGAAKGIGVFFINQTVVRPILGALLGAAIPIVGAVVKKHVSNLPKEKIEAMRAKVKSMGFFIKDEDGDGIDDELAARLAKQKWEKKVRKAKTIGTYSAGFAACAVVGLV